jgi:hypothetical protein
VRDDANKGNKFPFILLILPIFVTKARITSADNTTKMASLPKLLSGDQSAIDDFLDQFDVR